MRVYRPARDTQRCNSHSATDAAADARTRKVQGLPGNPVDGRTMEGNSPVVWGNSSRRAKRRIFVPLIGAAGWTSIRLHASIDAVLLLNLYGPASRGVVWAHISHLGDASATAMSARGAIRETEQRNCGGHVAGPCLNRSSVFRSLVFRSLVFRRSDCSAVWCSAVQVVRGVTASAGRSGPARRVAGRLPGAGSHCVRHWR